MYSGDGVEEEEGGDSEASGCFYFSHRPTNANNKLLRDIERLWNRNNVEGVKTPH